jgi:hypothetical protein
LGRITDIQNIINSTIPHYSHVKVFPRGLPLFIDPLLRGTVRFCRRTGNSISTVNTDNTFFFSEAPKLKNRSVVLTRNPLPAWVSPGVIVSLGPRKELNVIDDVVDTTLILTQELRRNYTTQDSLLLYAHPLKISVDTSVGDIEVFVKSKYKLANGEVFAYLQATNLLQSLTEIRASQAVYLGTTADPVYVYLYKLTLEKSLEKKLLTNEIVYHRMFPAYFSQQIRVPNALQTTDPIGPFLLDILSGRLTEGKSFKETLSLKTLDRNGNYLSGNSGTYLPIEKNHVIFDRPLSAHYPMYWETAEGSMRITPSRCVLKVNGDFKFVVGLRCVPHIPAGKSWRINLNSNEDCSIRFIFSPHPEQEFFLAANVNQTITVTIPTGEDASHIEINVLGNSGSCEVKLSDWTLSQSTVEQIEYSLLVEAEGEAKYQSTGIILKPYFIGSEFLRTYWDANLATFDGGKVYF